MGHGTSVNDSQLPNGVAEIVDYLARHARGYNNHLKWNEVAKLKADLMHVPERWLVIDPEAVRSRGIELGMREEDVDEVFELVSKAKEGRRLFPQRSYKKFKFLHPVTVLPEFPGQNTTNLIDR